MRRTKAGIINVTGYIGAELARLLYQHPEVELSSVTGRSAAGQQLGDVFPHLGDLDFLITAELDKDVDIVFSAMPHGTSIEVVPRLLEQGVRVIDISADFRLKDVAEYPRWYGFAHPRPELLKDAVYGLPELHKSDITSASLVANPGCYSTAAILALAPAVKGGLIHPSIINDSKSGVSGAGRTLTLATHYCEANDNVWAYAIDGHRHLPEMEQELEMINPGLRLSITFVPHLVPMTRGILSSCYARLKKGKLAKGAKAREELQQLYRDFYRDAPFVRITKEPPETKHTWGNNLCSIYPTIDLRTENLIIISCIDNLVKGGAGQAIQNMNLMLNLPETTGLETLAIYP
ncbi:N-acetyl-gamma-glutamyl-phosphate reductase [subsurface metagenome]